MRLFQKFQAHQPLQLLLRGLILLQRLLSRQKNEAQPQILLMHVLPPATSRLQLHASWQLYPYQIHNLLLLQTEYQQTQLPRQLVIYVFPCQTKRYFYLPNRRVMDLQKLHPEKFWLLKLLRLHDPTHVLQQELFLDFFFGPDPARMALEPAQKSELFSIVHSCATIIPVTYRSDNEMTERRDFVLLSDRPL